MISIFVTFSKLKKISSDANFYKNNLFPFLFNFLWRLIRLNLKSQNGQIQTLKFILSRNLKKRIFEFETCHKIFIWCHAASHDQLTCQVTTFPCYISMNIIWWRHDDVIEKDDSPLECTDQFQDRIIGRQLLYHFYWGSFLYLSQCSRWDFLQYGMAIFDKNGNFHDPDLNFTISLT